MDLSLATTNTDQEQDQEQEREQEQDNIGSSSTNTAVPIIEKEHMFDKVVTPSDVGKLNRLVIPKQHAEKYFPLDASSNQSGMLLNFEDRNGKAWRFRYSYWNSSQSYVMTKGWSRFVKEKKLDAGDVVLFQRGVGEMARSRLYIDWRHRPENVMPYPNSGVHQFSNLNFPPSVHFGRVFNNYSPDFRGLNFGVQSYNSSHYRNLHHHYHQMQHKEQEIIGYGYGSIVGRCFVRSLEQNPIGSLPLVIDSVPVVPGRIPAVTAAAPMAAVTGKRLRLFGVNMDCANDDSSTGDECSNSDIVPRGEMGGLPSASSSYLQRSMSCDDDQYAKKGKSSLSFDLDL